MNNKTNIPIIYDANLGIYLKISIMPNIGDGNGDFSGSNILYI